MKNIFIDGHSGTTGIQITEKLKKHQEINLLTIKEEHRKDDSEKLKLIEKADCVILCLPDPGAKNSVALIENTFGTSHLPIIDASTAHRTNDSWTYGFPEIKPDNRSKIKNANKISNPGCYPTGFISLLHPLIHKKLISKDSAITVNAVSGYSGGGKGLIKEYENNPNLHYAPYALSLSHKHVPEMQKHSGLSNSPCFVPAVAPYYQGMLVQVPLHKSFLEENNLNKKKIQECFNTYYDSEQFIKISDYKDVTLRNDNFLDVCLSNNSNNLDIFIFGEDDHHLVIAAKLDNLGKGASGAAVQNMNILFDFPENTAL